MEVYLWKLGRSGNEQRLEKLYTVLYCFSESSVGDEDMSTTTVTESTIHSKSYCLNKSHMYYLKNNLNLL